MAEFSTAATTEGWDRIAGARPRLRSQAKIYCHQYRGQSWFVLQDRASALFYRFSGRAYAFIQQLNGQHSIQSIFDRLRAAQASSAPSQQEIVQLLAQLNASDLLHYDQPLDTEELAERRRRHRRSPWLQRLMQPLAIRFPLADPDSWMVQLQPFFSRLYTRTGFLLWCLLCGFAAMAALSHWSALSEHWSSRALDPQNIVLLFLLYPVIKALHELGHGMAVKLWGGEVHEIGIMLLVFMPVPYVDASSASAFVNKWRRIVVGAAGIMVELLLAALGMLIWLSVEPGLIRDMAFNVMLIGGISTVLFNGNPLLRFDGYYVLADWLEIPNLASRSNQYLGYLVKRYVYCISGPRSPVSATGERAWFVLYGISAFFYRLFISLTIALFVAGQFFVIGMILAVWALIMQILYPLYRRLDYLVTSNELVGRRRRALSITFLAVLLVFVLTFVLPVPSWTNAEGILRLPEETMVRTNAEGFIVRVLQADGSQVHQDTPLFEIDDPLLQARHDVTQAKLAELQTKQTSQLLIDRTRVAILRDEIASVEAQLADIQQRLNDQIVVSKLDGIFVAPLGKNMLGRFVEQGSLLGYVAAFSDLTVRVAVPQQTLDRVRRHTDSVMVRLAADTSRTLPAQILREVPQVSDQLPSSTLGSQAGGSIAVDARDESGIRAMNQIYQLDIALPGESLQGYIGGKVHVRFNHAAEPIGRQWLRSLRQLVLQRLQI
jgi:putative peptide zinc metalloprotease protein